MTAKLSRPCPDSMANEIAEALTQTTEGPWSYAHTGDKDNSWGLGVAMDEDDQELAGLIEADDYEVGEGIAVSAVDLGNFADPHFMVEAHNRYVPLLLADRAASDKVIRDLLALLDTAPVAEWNGGDVVKRVRLGDQRVKAAREFIGGKVDQEFTLPEVAALYEVDPECVPAMSTYDAMCIRESRVIRDLLEAMEARLSMKNMVMGLPWSHSAVKAAREFVGDKEASS